MPHDLPISYAVLGSAELGIVVRRPVLRLAQGVRHRGEIAGLQPASVLFGDHQPVWQVRRQVTSEGAGAWRVPCLQAQGWDDEGPFVIARAHRIGFAGLGLSVHP